MPNLNKKISILILPLFFIKLSFAEPVQDPEKCVLNAISNNTKSSNIYEWQIREICLNVFLDAVEKDATPIPKNLISQATLSITKYPTSNNIFGTINLKNNSTNKVIYAMIAITDLENEQVEYYRFRPIRSLIPAFSIGEIKGTIMAPKINTSDATDFAKKYSWSFLNVYGYH